MVGSGEAERGGTTVAGERVRAAPDERATKRDDEDDRASRMAENRRLEDEGQVAESGEASDDVDAGEGEDERMATSEERMMILRMVEQGKINAEEGARLLAALGNRAQGAAAGKAPPGRSSGRSGRVFRVRVTDNLTGRQKVNVDIPLALAEFGLRFVPKSAGVDVESIRQALDAGIEGRVLDVVDHEDGHRVEVFIE